MARNTACLTTTAWLSRVFIAAALALPVTAEAQYFGRNKVQHESFDFVVLKTEHFDIYHYAEEAGAVQQAARLAERWYSRLSTVLGHELSSRQPLVLYASHPHFQQTTTISGAIGEGTGGVTEGLKRRIVLPFAAGLAETDHVLGHELVHAFQYDILGRGAAINGLPLWFIEGMAEYLSLGSDSAQTAMWLRDAAMRERLPTVKTLGHPRYFPYRFGHAFWAWAASRWGDRITGEALRAAAGGAGQQLRGPEQVLEAVTGMDHEAMTAEWHAAIAAEVMAHAPAEPRVPGRVLFGDEALEERELNLGPSLSPDGRRLAFLSAREQLSVDLFVADVETGRVERKLLSTAGDPHFESLQFISSAGAWDPSGRQVAVAALAAARPVLAIFDADSGRRTREIALPGMDEAMHPAWSPDGRTIALSVLAGGLSDLALVDVERGVVRRLTDDPYAQLHPSWSPDGRQLVFTTDRFSSDLDRLAFTGYALATIDVGTRQVQRLDTRVGGSHRNPQFSPDGRSVYFIATAGGVANLHRFDLDRGTAARLTDVATGVSGITPMSPALTVASAADRVAYVVFANDGYSIRIASASQLGGPEVAGDTARPTASRLAPPPRESSIVDRYLREPVPGLPPVAAVASAETEAYRPRLTLDFVGQEFGAVGLGPLGARAVGGVSLLFSDMLGEHTLGTTFQVNGAFEDIGGQVAYINRARRWNWGVVAEQIPYVTGAFGSGVALVDGVPAEVQQAVRFRQVDQEVGAIAAYPFSRVQRLEFGASARRISFEEEILTRAFALDTGQLLIDEEEERRPYDPINLAIARAALVYDSSVVGPTSPVLGQRYRLEVSPTGGSVNFVGVLADYRRYLRPVRPWTVAARVMHVGRYGGDATTGRLGLLFLGYPTLIRGYDIGSLDASECSPSANGRCDALDRLVGSRLAVANVEVRVPLVGAFTRNYDYGPVPVELFGFADAGAAWGRPSQMGSLDTEIVRSVGAGVRVNALGFLVLQIDAVRPLDRPNDRWRWQFVVSPGF